MGVILLYFVRSAYVLIVFIELHMERLPNFSAFAFIVKSFAVTSIRCVIELRIYQFFS